MAKVEVTMPKMGESITEGTVIAWHKEPGDSVEADEILLEIGTDKVDTEVPSPEAGVLAQILVQEGETVDVGTAIAILETDVEAVPETAGEEGPPEAAETRGSTEETDSQKASTMASASEPAPKSAQEPRGEGSSTKESPAEEGPAEDAEEEPHLEVRSAGDGVVEVVMPKMGESITEGTIIAWHKQVGDPIEEDEILLEIGTDKVDTDVPSPAAGTLEAILIQEGDTVEVGTAIARIATAVSAQASSAPSGPEPEPEEKAPAAANGEAAGAGRKVASTIERIGPEGGFFSPLVRSIAEKEGVTMQELEQIAGSGREGRVTKKDVLAYVEGRGGEAPEKAPPAPPPAVARRDERPVATPSTPQIGARTGEGRTEIVQMDRMRQIIAEHMVRSKATSAHVTSFAEADVTNLVRVREKNRAAFEAREGIKLTYSPFFVHAAVQALQDHPLFNASVEGTQIIMRRDLHIGIAVAIGKKGLVAPVIRNAQDKNLVGLARAAADMAERARNKQLQPDELQGGTFTLTNIGSLGSIMGTPIINQPQVSILATGAIKKRPVVIEDPEIGDVIAIRHMMYLSLSYDHRIIDGAMGASFLQRFVEVLESYDPNEEL